MTLQFSWAGDPTRICRRCGDLVPAPRTLCDDCRKSTASQRESSMTLRWIEDAQRAMGVRIAGIESALRHLSEQITTIEQIVRAMQNDQTNAWAADTADTKYDGKDTAVRRSRPAGRATEHFNGTRATHGRSDSLDGPP